MGVSFQAEATNAFAYWPDRASSSCSKIINQLINPL
jgi:hypothetical protein